MKYNHLFLALTMSSLLSCQTNSIRKDFHTGLEAKGEGLSCQNVFLSDGQDKHERTTFVYGEKFYLNFNDITGFKTIDKAVFPGMELLITDHNKDTVMYKPDLYQENPDGFEISPLLLHANVTAAAPIHSHGNYNLRINIWDKKGEGKYSSSLDFDIVPDKEILVNDTGVTYDEIYLFSAESKLVLRNNEVKFNETIYLIFEGLQGFTEKDGKSEVGVSIIAKDADGNIILEENDLLENSNINAAELNKQLAPNFIFLDPAIITPVSCEVFIWDKIGEHSIKASTQLTFK